MKQNPPVLRLVLCGLWFSSVFPSALALKIVYEIAKYQASSIEALPSGGYSLVTSQNELIIKLLSYIWLWGPVLLCVLLAITTAILLLVRRGAPCAAICAIGASDCLLSIWLAGFWTLISPGIYDFELVSYTLARVTLQKWSVSLPTDVRLYTGKLLLILLGLLFLLTAAAPLVLAVTELILLIRKRKTTQA